MSDLPSEIDRIDALTKNARNTWFALLGALVFMGMTLMGVEHIDFYGVNRATKLPLVDVAVPTLYFFAAAPILTAAIYGYFHLYLIRLWDAIGSAPASYIDEKAGGTERLLGDVIAPWLVTDAALQLRRYLRSENCTTPRMLEFLASVSNGLLSWLGGIIILYLMWDGSFPARTFWISAISAIAFGMAITTGLTSLVMLFIRMHHCPRKRNQERKIHWSDAFRNWSFWLRSVASILLIAGMLLYSHRTTEGTIDQVASLNMIDQQIVERPSNWLPYGIAQDEFRAKWCGREGINDCTTLDGKDAEFLEEWDQRRSDVRYALNRPNYLRRAGAPPDLREALMSSSFMAGAVLWQADMEMAQFQHAQMEGAFFNFAKMKHTIFTNANLQSVNFSYSLLSGTSQFPNNFIGADISAATSKAGAFRHVEFRNLKFDGQTDFRNTFLDGTVSVPADFARRMGGARDRPCQWLTTPLSDAQFYSVWRWWVEIGPDHAMFPDNRLWEKNVAPKGWENVVHPTAQELADLNLTNCKWATGELPARVD